MAKVVIDLPQVLWVLGGFLVALAATMLLPAGYALAAGQPGFGHMLEAVVITLAAAGILLLIGYRRERRELRQREAILLVVLIWLAVCLFGALPFMLSGYYHTFTDAVFEAASGFTTTGATVVADVDGLSRPVHLWRALSHWLGGMGIVVLGLAVLPLIGQGGSGLYQAEFSGANSERLHPRVAEIARSLWRIYLLLTVAEVVCLMAAGMGAFEAVCHAFSTLGTGGFSTRTASIAAYQSPLIEYIVILFMLLAGISFIQHYRLWVERDPRAVWRDYELRTFLIIALAASTVIAATLALDGVRGWEVAFRTALFQVVSILTGTGFATADYAGWLPLAQLILVALMFVGGCTGSTAGGLKVARSVLIVEVVRREFRRVAEPQGVFRVRLGDVPVPDQTVSALVNLVFLALMTLLAASLVLTATGVDLTTALSAVIACQFNVGPGLAGVGPLENYGWLPDLAKWVLSCCMVAGRLEFYTALVIFAASFWRG